MTASKITMKKMFLVSGLAAALLALGAAGGLWWATHRNMGEPDANKIKTANVENKVLYWYDPMVPQQHFDQPGKSPFMDMALVPKYAETQSETLGVKIDPVVLQNLGVRTGSVTRIALNVPVETPGTIGFDERDVVQVQSRGAGFVERTWPLAPGDVVKSGQALVKILIPEWVGAQHEFLVLAGMHDPKLLSAARERLRLTGMPESMIQALEKRGKPRAHYIVRAPIDGVVQALDVRAGMTLASGQTLLRINGIKTVWLEVAVPEALAESVHIGDSALAHLASFPGQVIKGQVMAIVPILGDVTRSLRVRIALPNPEGRLRPGMSAQVSLQSNTEQFALAIPTEAVIRTGKHALVMSVGEKGHFVPVEVTLGREVGNQTVIVAGLTEGQNIVLSGQFLIDSEASLSGFTVESSIKVGQNHAETNDAVEKTGERP